LKSSNFTASLICAALLIAASLVARPTPTAGELFKQSLNQDDVKALETLARAQTIDPENVDVLYRIGYIYHKMNRIKEAAEYYNAVIQRRSCYKQALNNLAGIQLLRKEDEKADEMYRAAIRCDPRAFQPLYNLANMLADRGKDDQARSLYEAALKLNPRHMRSHHNLALLLLRQATEKEGLDDQTRKGLLNLAETHLSKAVSLAPEDPLNRLNLARVLKAE